MALTTVQQVRLLVADNTPGLYIISDDEIQFFLERNNNNITRASLDAARVILLNLAQRSEESVDIFSIKGGKAATEYRLALKLFLTDPSMNPSLQNCSAWFGGVSKLEQQQNDLNIDNRLITSPYTEKQTFPTNPFEV